jgi:NADP-dependent 3-hydroxy acid dehydrogenase YdfG
VDAALRRLETTLGVPDIVVSNAGVFAVKPLADTTPADFTASVATNLTGPFLVAHALVPAMARRGSGHLVTIGSSSDHIAYPGNSAYAAAKYGLRGLHEVIAAELAGTGVRATLVSPGAVDTAMWDAIDPDSKPGFRKRQDMMRPEDVAETVVFVVTRPERMSVTEIRLAPTRR